MNDPEIASREDSSPLEAPAVERLKINLRWLLALRWAAAVGQLLTIGVVLVWLKAELPLAGLLSIIAIELVTNAAFSLWFIRQWRDASWDRHALQTEWLMGGIMLLDILLLTGLLYFAGGPTNPFSVFYVVNLSLAAVVLRPRWALVLASVSVLCFTGILLWHRPLEVLEQDARWPFAPNVGDLGISVKIQGLWVALAGALLFMVYFITRVTAELARRERQLRYARQRRAQSQKLEALATLAAGAAHELATPLSTIAVVARELEVELERAAAAESTIQDAQLIRREVARCRGILDLMSAEAGESAGEEIREMDVAELLQFTLGGMTDGERVRLTIPDATRPLRVRVPRHALAQSLRGLLRNALDASPDESAVDLQTSHRDGRLRIIIEDRGTGMSSEVLARAGEPFFTTKEPGQGMGMGLFLTRKVIEHVGGTLELSSHPGHGTTAEIQLPVAEKSRLELPDDLSR